MGIDVTKVSGEMSGPRLRAPKHRWHAFFASVCLGITCLTVGMLVHDWRQAELLDRTGIRVTGVVARIVPHAGRGGGNDRGEIVYTVAGHRHTVLKELGGKHYVSQKGRTVCLEASGERPLLTRLCGDRYPDGDDGFPGGVLTAVAATIGFFFVIGRWVIKRREALAASPPHPQARRVGIKH
ncbi:hypothetical protein ABT076_22885 [Streptomyces sp. NPDC002131]|uniref:hypothetical protein n=1 Tax=unclassified Streptomyces TaxID=2593676 RepID=UPI003328F098